MKHRVIIAGSRDLCIVSEDPDKWIEATLRASFGEAEFEIVSGNFGNIDLMGEAYAEKYGYELKLFPVSRQEWTMLGKYAGPARNKRMAEYAAQSEQGVLLLIWDGKSRGSASMKSYAEEYGLTILEFKI